jgi:hypothetical protein
MHVKTIDAASRHRIAQSLEGGPHQSSAAVALVGEALIGREGEAVLHKTGG